MDVSKSIMFPCSIVHYNQYLETSVSSCNSTCVQCMLLVSDIRHYTISIGVYLTKEQAITSNTERMAGFDKSDKPGSKKCIFVIKLF